MNTINRLSSVVTVDSVRNERMVWFSWKRAMISPVLRFAKNGSGSDRACLKNPDIMEKSMLRIMKLDRNARIRLVSWVNTLARIRPTIRTCSSDTFS